VSLVVCISVCFDCEMYEQNEERLGSIYECMKWRIMDPLKLRTHRLKNYKLRRGQILSRLTYTYLTLES